MGLIKPSKVNLDNEIYSVSLKGVHTGDAGYETTSTENFIIDSLGNFVLEIKNLDNFCTEFRLQGIFVDGLTEVINKYNITSEKFYQAVYSAVENGLIYDPFACGCNFRLGVTEISDLYFHFANDGIHIPMGACAMISGKLY